MLTLPVERAVSCSVVFPLFLLLLLLLLDCVSSCTSVVFADASVDVDVAFFSFFDDDDDVVLIVVSSIPTIQKTNSTVVRKTTTQ